MGGRIQQPCHFDPSALCGTARAATKKLESVRVLMREERKGVSWVVLVVWGLLMMISISPDDLAPRRYEPPIVISISGSRRCAVSVICLPSAATSSRGIRSCRSS